MTYALAVLLGILQGLTEFFPVSSSGHLALFGAWFGLEEPDLTFDILLHLATLAAIMAYFRKDWIAFFGRLLGKPAQEMPRLIVPYLIVATIPAVAVGYLFKDDVVSFHHHTEWVAICLFITGAALLSGLLIKDRAQPYRAMTWGMVLAMGVAQAAALLPGISRSGMTIMAGIFLGLERRASARFSFLMAAPVIVGAGTLAAIDLWTQPGGLTGLPWGTYTMGFAAAFISGFFALAFLMRLLAGNRFFVFGVYCVILAGLALWAPF